MSGIRSRPTLRVGIIGLGRAGGSMLPGIAAHPRVKITAGSDLRRDALERFAIEFEAQVYPDAEMREIVLGGELGPLGMIQTYNYKHFLHAPRRPEELDTSLGGGIIYNQVPHQIDIVRVVAGGIVRSVRSMAGVWDPTRPTEGAHVSFLELADGAAASVVFNGYGHFDSDEFHFWIGEGGQERDPERSERERAAMRDAMSATRTPEEEAALKASTGYGGNRQRGGQTGARHHSHFGVTIASCHKGDMRPSADGVFVFSGGEKREIPVPVEDRQGKVIDELLGAIEEDRPVIRDGRWGKATLEVCLAILQSSREKREVELAYQVPVPDAAFA